MNTLLCPNCHKSSFELLGGGGKIVLRCVKCDKKLDITHAWEDLAHTECPCCKGDH